LAYVGEDGEEEMMEDTVGANKFFTNLSCLDDNINENKNRGLFLTTMMMMVQPIARK
jgi:hypothetical protein